MTRPADTYCSREERCICAAQPSVVKSCMYMGGERRSENERRMIVQLVVQERRTHDRRGTEAALQRAELASGMTREQAFEPNGIFAGLPFVNMPDTRTHAEAMRDEVREGVSVPLPSPVMPFPSFSTPVVPFAAPKTSPGQFVPDESRKNKFREEVEDAAAQVAIARDGYAQSFGEFVKDPRSAKLRRELSFAFSKLSAAQFRLEQSLDRVPPRIEE